MKGPASNLVAGSNRNVS